MKDSMSKTGDVVRGLGTAGIYALVFWAIKETPSHMNLSAAFRLVALLLLPTRLWPSIIAADIAATFGFATQAFDKPPYTYTPLWVLAASILPISCALQAAAILRRWNIQLVPANAAEATRLVVGLIGASAICAAGGVMIFSTQTASAASMGLTIWELFGKYFLGVVVGLLCVAPVLAAAKRLYRPTFAGVRQAIEAEISNAHQCILIAAAMLATGVIGAQLAHSTEVLWSIRVAMLAPLLVCAVQYGWRGAVVSIPMMDAALELTWVSHVKESGFWWVLGLSAGFSAMALIVGAHSSRQRAVARQAAEEKFLADEESARWRDIAQTQRALPVEILRRESEIIEEIRELLHQAELLAGDPSLKRDEEVKIQWRTFTFARRLLQERSELLAPPLLEKHGLRTAIYSSPVVKELRSAGALVFLHLSDPADHLTRGTQLTVYRFVHQILAVGMRDGTITQAFIRLRTGGGADRPWVALKVSMKYRSEEQARAMPRSDHVAGTLQGMGQLAKAYGGVIRQRPNGCVRTVASLLFDLDAGAWSATPASFRQGGMAS
jgi:glucose-6-phosphate-specific signal transduction histidine kinase